MGPVHVQMNNLAELMSGPAIPNGATEGMIAVLRIGKVHRFVTVSFFLAARRKSCRTPSSLRLASKRRWLAPH